jgi:hypothetical protein
MKDTVHSSTNVLIQVYDADVVPTADAAPTATAIKSFWIKNTTRDAYHEAVIGGLDGQQPDLAVDALVLGDSTQATANVAAGQALGNETFRTTTVDTSTSGQTFTASTFIDSTEGNQLVFEEAALVAVQPNGNDLPINRFLIDDPGGLLSPKTQNETVTIDIQISQTDI